MVERVSWQVNIVEGPKFGKYKINLKDLDQIGVNAIKKALENAEFIFIDEIGPMELKSEKFARVVETALDSEIPVIAVIHQRSRHHFILNVKNRDDVTTFEVSQENREFLHKEIIEMM